MKKKILKIVFLCVSIVALMAAMLVPCFAVSAPDVTPDYYTAFVQLMPDYVKNNYAFIALLDAYRQKTIPDVGSGGLFSNQFLYVLQQEDLNDYLNMGDSTHHHFYDANLFYIFDCEYLGVTFVDATNVATTYGRYSSDALISIFLSFEDDAISGNVTYYFDSGDEFIFYLRGSSYGGVLELWYDNFIIVNSAGDLIAENDIRDVVDFQIAFTVEDALILGSDIEGLAMLNSLLNYGTVNYTSLYNPYQFYQGYKAGLSGELGYQEGYDEGYLAGGNDGYLEGKYDGYTEGKQDGYDSGYTTGYNDALISVGDEAYNAGYNAAVKEIDSGEFGRNLLGGTFSAPFDALNSLKLIQFGDVSITLGSIIAAAICIPLLLMFLKMFGG